jgi:hypothetical protein
MPPQMRAPHLLPLAVSLGGFGRLLASNNAISTRPADEHPIRLAITMESLAYTAVHVITVSHLSNSRRFKMQNLNLRGPHRGVIRVAGPEPFLLGSDSRASEVSPSSNGDADFPSQQCIVGLYSSEVEVPARYTHLWLQGEGKRAEHKSS